MCPGAAMKALLTVLLHLLHPQSTSLSLVVHLQALQLAPGYPPLPMLDPHLLQLTLLISLARLNLLGMVLPARSSTLPHLRQLQLKSWLLQHPRRLPRMFAYSPAHQYTPSRDRNSCAIAIGSMVAKSWSSTEDSSSDKSRVPSTLVSTPVPPSPAVSGLHTIQPAVLALSIAR